MNKLKELRGKRKLTDVAADLNLTAKTYYNYESGTRQPDHDTLCRIADCYAVTVDYLLGRHAQTKEHNEMLLIGAQVRLPILGCVRAGRPMYAVENIEGYENADAKYAEGHFYLRVEGDSMTPTIPRGSLVLVRSQNSADPGQIVACLVDGDYATLKRYKPQTNGIILLQADNPTAESYTVKAEDFSNGYASILGVAVEVKYKL